MCSDDIRTKVNWLDREEIVVLLEEGMGMACYDDEEVEELRDCLVTCVEAGDIILD